MPIKAVLFDHDGTLVDSETTHLALWRKAVEPFGGFITDDEYWHTLLGVPTEQNAADLITLRGLNVSVHELLQAKLNHVEEFIQHSYFPQMDGADTIVRDLADHVRLALVSGSLRMCVDASLRGHNWTPLFEHVVTGDDVSRNKPDPASYKHALSLMALDAADCVAVEDTQSGVRAAAAAGLRTVAIRNQHSASHDFSAATVEVPDLYAAYHWIKQQL